MRAKTADVNSSASECWRSVRRILAADASANSAKEKGGRL